MTWKEPWIGDVQRHLNPHPVGTALWTAWVHGFQNYQLQMFQHQVSFELQNAYEQGAHEARILEQIMHAVYKRMGPAPTAQPPDPPLGERMI